MQAAVLPELQDGPQEREAALTMPPRWFPRGRRTGRASQARRGGVGDLEGPLRPPSPTPPSLWPHPSPASQELRRPFVRPQGHTRALGAAEGRESGALSEKGPYPCSEASASRSHGSGRGGRGWPRPGPAALPVLYGPQDSVCLQSQLRCWGLGGGGGVEKLLGQEWTASSGRPGGSPAAFVVGTWPETFPDHQPGPTVFCWLPPTCSSGRDI